MTRLACFLSVLAITQAAEAKPSVETFLPVTPSALDDYRIALSRLRSLQVHPPRTRLRDLFTSYATRQFGWEPLFAHTAMDFEGDVTIDPQAQTISSTATMKFKVLGDGHDTIAFVTSLPVSRVTDAQGNDVDFQEVDTFGLKTTQVKLDPVPVDGDVVILSFRMEGQPSCTAGGPFGVQVCKLDKGISFLASSAFLPTGLMGDFATMDLTVRVPAGYTVAATGIVTDTYVDDLDSPHVVYHIVQDFPTEVSSLVMANYVKAQVPTEFGMAGVFTSDNPLIASVLPDVLKDMASILSFYSDQYGDFIFPKMDVAEVTDDAGAAFGWPALLWIPTSTFLIGLDGGGFHSGQRTALFAHELAHQWFPDAIKSNDAYAPWLSEGFAEFSSVYYMTQAKDENFMRNMFEYYSLLYRYLVPPEKDFPLTSKAATETEDPFLNQVITYFKGAIVVETIRAVIGQQAFLKALRQMYKDLAGQRKYYTTADLQKYFEDAYGKALDWLFQEWVYGKGYPIYKVAIQKDPSDDQHVVVNIHRSANMPNTSFDMPVSLLLVTEKAQEKHVEWIDKEDVSLDYETNGRFLRLRFDPEQTFVKRLVPALPGDYDLSGEVDGIDLLYAAWSSGGVLGKSPNFLPFVDTNQNGVINDEDTASVFEGFGSTQGQEAK